jgi:hypothetical protein
MIMFTYRNGIWTRPRLTCNVAVLCLLVSAPVWAADIEVGASIDASATHSSNAGLQSQSDSSASAEAQVRADSGRAESNAEEDVRTASIAEAKGNDEGEAQSDPRA